MILLKFAVKCKYYGSSRKETAAETFHIIRKITATVGVKTVETA